MSNFLIQKYQLKVNCQGQMTLKSNHCSTYIHTKLHQFLMSGFSVFFAQIQRHANGWGQKQ